jgi:ubiquinone/menaquinone biosynthesis C-methylase UbiE
MSNYAHRNAAAYDELAPEWDASMAGNMAHRYLEKPAMATLVPSDLQFKDVLCIGVGAGDELADIVIHNPRRIVGIDTSRKLLDIASAKYPSLEAHCMDMMSLEFPDGSFDFVYSSLAFHYANDWDTLLAGIYRVLRPGGIVLFSTHHPVYWGAKEATGNTHTNARGVTLTERTATAGIVFYNHPSIDSLVESVTHAGFRIAHQGTPKVVAPLGRLSPHDGERYRSLVATNAVTPLFYIVKATRAR